MTPDTTSPSTVVERAQHGAINGTLHPAGVPTTSKYLPKMLIPLPCSSKCRAHKI